MEKKDQVRAGRRKNAQRFVLELSTVLFFFAKNASLPLSQQYAYHIVATRYDMTPDIIEATSRQMDSLGLQPPENVNTSSLSPINLSQLLKTYGKVKKINEEGSLIVLYMTIAELLPSAIAVIIFGIYSDYARKRKFLMHLPCLGTSVYSIGFILSMKLGGEADSTAIRTIMIMASIISGLSGSFSGYLCGNSSYISDTDTEERRTFRLALVELFIGVTFGLASLMNGIFIANFGNFEQLFWMIFFVSTMTFFLILLFLDEPSEDASSDQATPRDPQKAKFTVGFSADLRPSTLRKIWLTFGGFIIFVFVQQGQERTFVPFLKGAPLLWDSFRVGVFLFVVYTFAGIGAWPGVIWLKRCCGDLVICMIAILSKIFGSIFLALSTTTGEAYGAGMIQMFHLIPYAVARSIISRQTSQENQGSIYAFVHSSQAIVGFLGPLCHNFLYTITMNTMGGMVFIISGCLLIVSLALFALTYYITQNDGSYVDLGGRGEQSGGTVRSLSESTAFANFSSTSLSE